MIVNTDRKAMDGMKERRKKEQETKKKKRGLTQTDV